MCVKLERNGRILIPRYTALIKYKLGTQSYENPMTWGLDLGYGLISNARFESIRDGKWKRHGLVRIGELYVDAFYELEQRFVFKQPRPVGVIHNTHIFLLVTEPAEGVVKEIHHRQPCVHLNILKQIA